jgi:hypothetical protein
LRSRTTDKPPVGEEGMNMVGSHMVEVEGMDTVEEHFHPTNH